MKKSLMVFVRVNRQYGQRSAFLMEISCFQSFGGGSNLNNLAKLMSNDSSASRLRSIVVSKTKKATFVPGLPKDVAIKGEQISFLSPELGFSL